jgi:hypothetical protein
MTMRRLMIATTIFSLGLVAACNDESNVNSSTTTPAKPAASNSPATTPVVKKVGVSEAHKPSAAAIAKAKAPKPPATAKKGTTIGKGRLAVNRKHDSSIWAEEIDVDGDGAVEQANFLYDDVDKVTFIYAEKDFPCADGRTGHGGVLTGVWAAGNKAGKLPGAGFWAADLDEGECGADAAGLWGCKFGPSGVATECGLAVVADEDITITDKAKSASTATPTSPSASPKAPANSNVKK